MVPWVRSFGSTLGPALPLIPLLTHIGELGLQESDTLLQVRNLRLKDRYVARRVLSRCIKLCHVTARIRLRRPHPLLQPFAAFKPWPF
jgi:hypothetical protein